MNENEKQAIESLRKNRGVSFAQADIISNLIENQQKEIEELKDTLKCTQNSWYKDTKLIQKQQKEIDELKEENRKLRKCHLRYEEMTGIDLLLEE